MRLQQNARIVHVNKINLIVQIQKNKANHIKEYEQAIIDYREEAAKQLKEQTARLEEGKLDIAIDLVSPVDKREEYDKIIEVFKWDVNEIVELSQGEFNEYVLDETHFAIAAKMSNMIYSKGR